MTDSNMQSNILIDLAPPVAPEEYLLNKAKIAEAKALISAYEEMNEAGKQSHDELARELEQKIREGEQAREQLLQLRSQSTLQIPSIRKLAIDFPSSTSRIEEVPNYDPGSGHSQQVQYQQFQGTSNQQAHNYIPQVTVQPVASGSYQQYNPQQWTPGNPNGGQSKQHSQYSQQPIMQNRPTSYSPYSFPSDQGNHNNHSHPVVPTQEQRRVSSHQEQHLNYGNSGRNQGQWREAQMYSPPQIIPVHAPGPSSQAAYKSRPPKNTQQSSPTNTYPEATVSQSQAMASGNQGPLLHKPTNITTTQSQLATALGPQPSALSSNSVPVPVTSPNPVSTSSIANPDGDRTSNLHQNATHNPYPLSHIPATLPSIFMNYTQFIRELREAIKDWDDKVPPNSYFDHPSNYFRIHKDLNGAIRIIMRGQGNLQGKSQVLEVDQFCDWIRHRNTATSVTPAVPANSQTGASSSTSNAQKATSTIHKAIPSTAVKANVQATSSATHRPGYPEPGASFSEQTFSTVSSSTHNQEIACQIARPSTPPPQNGSSVSQIQLSTPISVRQLPLAQTPSSASVPKTPSRQLSTIVNGVPRSAEQADKKFLASHILFGLGKRRRETETSPTASTEPQPKRHAQQATVAGVSPSASYAVDQTTTAQKPNVPNGASTASSSLQHPLQHNFIPYAIPRETPQMSLASSASSGDRQQPVNVTLEVPSTSKVAAAVDVPEVSKTPGDEQQPVNVTLEVPSTNKAAAAVDVPDVSRTPLSLQDARIVSSSGDHQQHPVNVTLDVLSTSKIAADVDVTEVSTTPLSLQDARIVPLATSSNVVQTSILPSPVPLALPVPVPSLLESGNIPQPVASTVLKQPQASTSAKLQLSFVGVPGLGMSDELAKKSQPLFLPSPVTSPGLDENDDVSMSGMQLAFDLRKFSSSAKRKNHAYVLAPRRPPYLVKYFRMEKQKISRASLNKRMASKSSLSKSVAGEEDFYCATENLSPSYAEQQVVQLASSRLQELSCKWNGCPVKMNSVDALIRHLNRQHKPPSTSHSKFFLCMWTLCGRRCNLHEKHLEKHAFLPLNCPYEDCEESFRFASSLLKHTRVEHGNDNLKPSTQLRCPTVQLPNAVLGVIPTYMIMTRRVNPNEISSARHAILAPRVLRDIAGLERDRSRNKAKKTVRSNGDIIPEEDSSNYYDFLYARPTRYSSHLSQPVDMRLDDLNSENVSRLVDEGLVLWGREGIAVRTAPPSPVADREHRDEGETLPVTVA